MPKKILFIEDETALQKTLGEVLIQEGYEVISALDGETGMELAETKNPDLILLDLILPKLNGFEVLEKLKENPATKNIPVIILTNLEKMEDIGKAMELGAKSYLVKSNYSLEEVLKKIKEIIEN
ncbi:MAG: response regulator [Candidatus Parcubacteria bacterium]|nr:response regulator [Candidatus Parcubacteria bacterium]